MVIPYFESIESIESIKIPNTEVMRSAANFWLVVAGVHTEKKQSLDAGVPAVEKSWQGRAGESYMQAIQKALLMGGMTQSQMLSVAKLLTSTAAQFDWGNNLQGMARRQWDAAKVFYDTGQVEAAAMWYASARTTQQSAVDVIREAHANYDVSLKQLQAELPNKPVTPDGHAITFVKSGQPLSPVSGPGEPDEPLPAYTPGEKPPAYQPPRLGPVSAENLTQNAMTPSDDTSMGEKLPTASPEHAVISSQLTQLPPHAPILTIGQSFNASSSLWQKPTDALREGLRATPLGQWALEIEQSTHVKLRTVTTGQASTFDGQINTITHARTLSPLTLQQRHMHEIFHLYTDFHDLSPNARQLSEDQYVQGMLSIEAMGEVLGAL